MTLMTNDLNDHDKRMNLSHYKSKYCHYKSLYSAVASNEGQALAA